ncbi:MAG TPA: response regulator [Gemmata sp.]|nr:response regulator [Gemmata sp.]
MRHDQDEPTEEIAVAPAGHEPLATPGSLRVLCVDDNFDAADSLGEMLAIAGHEVVVRHSGAAALMAVNAGFRPDVCVLDITMPGIDGCELATALRATRDEDDLLLIAVTALGDYRSLERMADSGFDLQFTKPVSPRDLYEALNFRARQLATRAAASRH